MILIANLWLSFFGRSLDNVILVMITCLLAGLFWEFFPKHSDIKGTFDVVDILFYIIGGLLIWMVSKRRKRYG